MANQPHPDKQAVTWRLHRDLVSRVRAAAAANGETVLALVTRALEREAGLRTDLADHTEETPAVTTIPDPPEGFRVATSVHEVLEAGDVRGRERDVLRLYVDRNWVPGRLDIAITRASKRRISRNVRVAWAGPSLGLGYSRPLPFERIAIPEETADA